MAHGYEPTSYEAPPLFLNQFEVADERVILQKLYAMRADPIRPELWSDFDKTLTSNSIWEIVFNVLSEDLQRESEQDRKKYMSMEDKGKLPPKVHKQWSIEELKRHIRNGSTEKDLEQEMYNLVLRPGVTELFETCQAAAMESHILSGSIAQAIRMLGIPAIVHANELVLEEGTVIGLDESKLVYGGNKHRIAEAALAAAGIEGGRARKILLGDTRTDARMFTPRLITDDRVIRIRTRENGGNSRTYLSDSFKSTKTGSGFDLVMKSEDLYGVVELIRWVTGLEEPSHLPLRY